MQKVLKQTCHEKLPLTKNVPTKCAIKKYQQKITHKKCVQKCFFCWILCCHLFSAICVGTFCWNILMELFLGNFHKKFLKNVPTKIVQHANSTHINLPRKITYKKCQQKMFQQKVLTKSTNKNLLTNSAYKNVFLSNFFCSTQFVLSPFSEQFFVAIFCWNINIVIETVLWVLFFC